MGDLLYAIALPIGSYLPPSWLFAVGPIAMRCLQTDLDQDLSPVDELVLVRGVAPYSSI